MANISASASKSTYAPYYSTSFPYTHYVKLEETSSSTSGNTSSVKVTAYLESSGASFESNYNNSLSVYWFDNNNYVDGKRVKLNNEISSLAMGGRITVTGTISVPHKSDGTVSGFARSYWTKSDNNNYTPDSSTAQTANTALTKIVRGSSISTDESSVLCDDHNGLMIRLTKPVSTYTDTITYKIGDVSGTIIEKTPATAIAWVVPLSVLNGMPNDTSGTMTLTCQTYNGSTKLGSSSTTVLITTSKELHGPSLSLTSIVDLNANNTYGSYTLGRIEGDSFISGLSSLQLTISAEARYGATRKRTETTLNGTTIGGTLTPVFTGDFGNGVFTITTRDSRGYTAEIHPTIDVVNYFAPAIAKATADRDSVNIENVRGITTGAWYNGSLGGMDNTLTVVARYNNPSATPASGDNTLTVTSTGNTWSFDGIAFGSLAAASAGTVQFIFSDLLNTVSSSVIQIYEYLPVFAMFKDHFDVIGELHIHDRANPNLFSVLTYNYYVSLFQYHVGDTVTFTDNVAVFPGFVTSSGGVLVFSIALPKSAEPGVVPSVSGNVIIRHSDGAYINSNDNHTNQQPVALSDLGTVTADCDANYVRVRVQLTTATSLTNNSVISVTPGTLLTITFNAAS